MGQVGTSVPSSKRVAKKERPQPKMIEAPSTEGAFLVSATPRIGKPWGVGTGDGGGERPHRYGRNGSSRPIESRQIPCDVWLRGAWTFIGSLGKVISTSTGQIGFRGC